MAYPSFIILTDCLFFLRSLQFCLRSCVRVPPWGSRTWPYATQIGALQRSAATRPKLTSGDRLFWIRLSRRWRDWRSALAIVKPETVLAWHRAGFRLFWTWKVRRAQPRNGASLIGRRHCASKNRTLVLAGYGAVKEMPAKVNAALS